MAVNLSARQFADESLVEDVERTLREPSSTPSCWSSNSRERGDAEHVCDEIRGHYFSKPIADAESSAFVRKHIAAPRA